MEPKPLNDELYREYEFGDASNRTIYRINNPVSLYVGTTTHRVLDSAGVMHCVPNIGVNGCVLRWQPRDVSKPVQF